MARATTPKRPRRAPARRTKRATAAPAAVPPAPPPIPAVPAELLAPAPREPEPDYSNPEAFFAARVPVEAERPLPFVRRAIFFDVENTSRPEHIARMIEHLAIDRLGRRTEFVAVGNWRVIGSDTARLLARHGAYLIHSAPSTGVRDWSDLRIAVSAGAWLAGARPGDVLEIVSDDRAFDAVGDVAAALGIAYRRLSYRQLAGAPAPAAVVAEVAEPAEPRPRRGRRGRYRGRRDGRAAPEPRVPHEPRPAAVPAERPHHEPVRHAAHAPAAADAHTAPHDAIIDVVRDLVQRAGGRPVLIDTLAHSLKARGFRRTPGSPRLITRLRRIKELAISSSGMISLVSDATSRPAEPEEEAAVVTEPVAAAEAEVEMPAEAMEPETGGEGEAEAPVDGGPTEAQEPRRRRSRRGGRRRRRRGPAPAAPATA